MKFSFERAESSLVALLLILSFFERVFYVILNHLPDQFIYSDMHSYVSIAEAFGQGNFTPQMMLQPPGLSLMLLFSKKVFGNFSAVIWLQIWAGPMTLWFSWAASKVFLNPRMALLGLALLTFHYPFIHYAGFYLAETFFTLVLSALMYFICIHFQMNRKRDYFILGLLFGVGFLFKATHIHALILAFALGFVWLARGRFRREFLLSFLISTGLFILGFALPAGAQATFMSISTNRLQLVPSGGGINFVEGKCPYKRQADNLGRWTYSPLFQATGEGTYRKWDRPFSDSGYYFKEGLRCIQREPMELLRSFRYMYYLFFGNPLWPEILPEFETIAKLSNLLFLFFIFPGFLLAILLAGFVRNPPAQVKILLLLMAGLFFNVWFFKSEVRYRIPFDILIFPLSLWAWQWVGRRARAGRPVVF